MKKILLLFLLGTTAQSALLGQNFESKLSEWTKTNPVEKLYLRLDRESYFAGQTIWLKGYFLSGWIPSNKNTTLYAELLNSQSEVVSKVVFPVNLGITWGQLEITENTPAGDYLLRAYSPLMLNQPGFVFHKRISIFGRETPKKQKNSLEDKTLVTFFPEGGNMVTGLLNLVAFKAIDKNGMPLQIEGNIKSDKGEIVTTFKTTHDGMGSFSIIPQEGATYYASISSREEQLPLPQQTSNGIVLTVKNTPRGKQFRIQYKADNLNFKPAYIIGQMDNQILFNHPLGDKKEITGIIPTKDFLSGILHLTVFNKDNMPLAERLTFIDNREYVLHATLSVDTLNVGERQRNRFSISIPDTLIGNFSVSVTDADYESATSRPQNIYSWFFLNSDIKGYVHNSAYYFSSMADSVKNALDLVMMTNGWTRFKWSEIKENKLSPPKFKDPSYIDLSGQITIEGRKKTLPNTDIIVLMSPIDTSQKRGMPYILKTDSLGHFKLDSQIFYSKNKILFSEVRGKKSKFIEVKIMADSLRRNYPLQPVIIPLDTAISSDNEKMFTAFDEYIKAEGKTLENVVVKARQKSEIEKLDERYASSLFSGGINSRSYDVRNEIFSGDVIQYLQGRIAGLTVSGTPGNYVIAYRGGAGLTGGNNVTLYLDEMQTDADMISSISVNQIAMIKLLPNSIAVPGNGTALVIYTKRGEDFATSVESATDIITYNGYTIFKEFYNPNYEKQPNTDKADNRLTLSWQPTHFVSPATPKINVVFYNNDRTKRFKVVAEGVAEDGRMLMIERIVE